MSYKGESENRQNINEGEEELNYLSAPEVDGEDGDASSQPSNNDWTGVPRSGPSKAPSNSSGVYLQRTAVPPPMDDPHLSPIAKTTSAKKFLITQPSDDEDLDDIEGENEDDFFGAGTPVPRQTSRLSQGGDTCQCDDADDVACSDSDFEPDIGVDIDNPEGYDTDLDIDGEDWLREGESFDPSGVKDYIEECNKIGVIPVSYFQKHIQDRQFVMKNHGLGPLGAKAIAKPLENNTFIERIDLEGNNIYGEGAAYLAKVLKDNLYVTQLILSENGLRSVGVKAVCEMLQDNQTITELDMSGNNIKDSDGEFFHNMLVKNFSLRNLKLSHNALEQEGGRWLRDALAQNENLKMLDLSWNHLRLKGAQYISELVMENYGLKYLNLAMNGMGNEGAKVMGHALAHNQCLLELNMSSNRITKDGAYHMSRGLLVNDVLETLRIGVNPIDMDGALVLLAAIDKNTNSFVNFLDLTNIIVSDAFDTLHNKMKSEDKRVLRIVHGGVIFKPKKVLLPEEDPESAFQRDPMTKLKHYAEVNKLRLIDLFKQFDKDNSMSLDRDEFIMGVKATGIELTEKEIDELINRLDQDGDGEIDYGELVFGDNMHRDEKRKLKEKQIEYEQKMKDKMKKEEVTDVPVFLGDDEQLIASLTPIEVT